MRLNCSFFLISKEIMQTCKLCGISKPHTSEFYRSTGNGEKLRKQCRECERILSHKRRTDDPENYRLKYNDWERQRKRDGKAKSVEYKGGKCSMCGGVFHQSVYDFHHVDPFLKELNVGQSMKIPWVDLKQELDKCIMVCSNCHRLIHHNKE